MILCEDFGTALSESWHQIEAGAGRLMRYDDHLRMLLAGEAKGRYCNAQIDDYHRNGRKHLWWRPPLRLTVRARFSQQELAGTAGFGFWNEPFLSSRLQRPTLPQAIWFFYASSLSDMALAMDVPGHGWKAATIDASRWHFPPLLLTMPVTTFLMRDRSIYRRLWPWYQRSMQVAETVIDVDKTVWHEYRIDWGVNAARFAVDGEVLQQTDFSPRGPLGLVIWLDNRWMVATPQGRLNWGVNPLAGEHWMELDSLVVERGAAAAFDSIAP